MTEILYGEGIGKQGKIRLGCSAAILDILCLADHLAVPKRFCF